jgi:3-oxoacyl-[acyl-carrier-protein] synthase II
MSRRRVVITGLGVVTPAGHDVASTWASLVAGRSAVRLAPRLDAAGCRSRIAAEVRDFMPDTLWYTSCRGRLARGVELALTAGREGWLDAGLVADGTDPTRAGVLVGTGFADAAETFHQAQAYGDSGVGGIDPGYVPRAMPNAAAAHLSLAFGLRGPSLAVSSACAAGGHAFGLAVRLVQSGDADVVLAGGVEEIACVLAHVAFDKLGALSSRNDEPERASRPFDRRRDGFVLGEGAAMAVVEALDHAERRGARTYAEIVGVGMAGEAHHITAPDPTGAGAARAMRCALEDAGRAPADVGYIHAHGTSTRLNDVMEARAIHQVFGSHVGHVAVSSTKSMVGHLIGASAGVGLVATVLALTRGVLPPTINLDEPDAECDLDHVANVARTATVELALVNAFAFGGHCVSLAIQRHP